MSSLARAVVGYEGAQRAATVHVGVCSALAMPKRARSTMAVQAPARAHKRAVLAT